MIAVTPARQSPNIAAADPLARLFLSRAAYADLLAPPVPFIVERRCGGNYQARLVFQGILVARMLYGRDDVSFGEIATFAQGISRSRLGEYIEFLCANELLEVVGHREDERLKGFNRLDGRRPGEDRTRYRTACYRIDLARLVQESAIAWSALIRELATGIPAGNPRRREPVEGQRAMDLWPSEGDHTETWEVLMRAGAAGVQSFGGQPDRAQPPVTGASPAGGQPASYGNGPTPEERPLFPYENSDCSPTGTAGVAPAAGEPSPRPYGNSATAHADSNVEQSRNGNSDRSPTGTALSQREPSLSPYENMVGGWVGESGGGEGGRGAAAPTLSLTDVRSVIQNEVAQAIQNALKALTLPQLLPPPVALVCEEDVPPAPHNEPAVEVGPVGAWQELLSRPATSAERGQIGEIVRTFTAPSGGTAAYWLVRVMYTVAIEGAEKLTLRYVRGVLKRLARANRWASEDLTLAAGEERREAAAQSPEQAPTPPRTPRGKLRKALELPAELQASSSVQVYLVHAPAKVTLTEVWARIIHDRVQHLPVWEGVCLNWSERNDYSAVAKMLDRYDNEVAALGRGPGVSTRPEQGAFDVAAASVFIKAHREAVATSEEHAEPEVPGREGADETPDEGPPSAAQRPASITPAQIWQVALGIIQATVDRNTFQTWFMGCRLVTLDQDTATVAVVQQYQLETLERNYQQLVRRALSDVLGRVVTVRFVVSRRP